MELQEILENLILDTHKAITGINNDDKSVNNVKAIVGSTINRMNMENKQWDEDEIAIFVCLKILMDHPFLDGNKRTAFTILLNQLNVEPNKIEKLNTFLFDK